jgi:hypothetical protein
VHVTGTVLRMWSWNMVVRRCVLLRQVVNAKRLHLLNISISKTAKRRQFSLDGTYTQFQINALKFAYSSNKWHFTYTVTCCYFFTSSTHLRILKTNSNFTACEYRLLQTARNNSSSYSVLLHARNNTFFV